MIQIDLPMPEACDICPMNYDFIWCCAMKPEDKDKCEFDKEDFDWQSRPAWCPLVEVKE